MRRNDVPGFPTRTSAVYDCILREFLEPQLSLTRAGRGRSLGNVVLSLVHMSTQSTVKLRRVPLNEETSQHFERLTQSYARDHGNYLPALETVDELLAETRDEAAQMIVMFLSDGEPSDHVFRTCIHGVNVWKTQNVQVPPGSRPPLISCGRSAWRCRNDIKRQIQLDCYDRVASLGDKFGRDRIRFYTVGFGPADEDFEVLQRMSGMLPQSGFQKLGLKANLLISVFSSLTSTLTSVREDSAGHGMTLRQAGPRESSDSFQERPRVITRLGGWNIYEGKNLVSKKGYVDGRYVELPLREGATGLAVFEDWFDQGSERATYRCFEVAREYYLMPAYPFAPPHMQRSEITHASKTQDNHECIAVGLQMVAKQSLFEEEMLNDHFHRSMAETQFEAQRLSTLFNERIQRIVEAKAVASSSSAAFDFAHSDASAFLVTFIPCSIYHVNHRSKPQWILAESFLDGCFVKWNNNGGACKKVTNAFLGDGYAVDDIPQTFSHFSWSVTDGDALVCDLQGVWNKLDGFMLTDPAIHYGKPEAKKRFKRRTDKGPQGIREFFASHVCSRLCRELGLKAPDGLSSANAVF
eukprot:m.215724 g.215724  ORF g.215724 m.215724 type:complete len:581 (-) comp42827_c0_seq1:210-1952(-)